MAYTAAELQRVTVLEQRITTVVGDFGSVPALITIPSNRRDMVSNLHRTACLL
jgi:hypothetical protein